MKFQKSTTFYISVAFLLLTLSSCLTARRAERQLDRILKRQPATAAEMSRKAFPCIPTRIDSFLETQTNTLYDWIELPCDSIVITEAGDTITYHKKSVTVKTYNTTNTIIKTRDRFIEDSAKVKIAYAALQKIESKNKTKTTFIWILLSLLLASGLLNWYLIRRK